MRQLIAGNWKMNGLRVGRMEPPLPLPLWQDRRASACDILVCPPFTLLSPGCTTSCSIRPSPSVARIAIRCHMARGPATSRPKCSRMPAANPSSWAIRNAGRPTARPTPRCTRRSKAATRAGLTPIVCVGETEAERDAGQETAIVGRQIAASLPDGFAGDVAYEPIWAIGTGRTPASLAEIAERSQPYPGCARAAPRRCRCRHPHSLWRLGKAGKRRRDPCNTRDVGGALIGGASLQAESFLAIAHCASTLA